MTGNITVSLVHHIPGEALILMVPRGRVQEKQIDEVWSVINFRLMRVLGVSALRAANKPGGLPEFTTELVFAVTGSNFYFFLH